MTHFPFS